MKYKRSALRRLYLEMPTLYVSAYEDGTILRHRQRVNFRVNTSEQPSRWYHPDGTLKKELWHDPNGAVKKSNTMVTYKDDGSVEFRDNNGCLQEVHHHDGSLKVYHGNGQIQWEIGPDKSWKLYSEDGTLVLTKDANGKFHH